jgi:hypothetical protein
VVRHDALGPDLERHSVFGPEELNRETQVFRAHEETPLDHAGLTLCLLKLRGLRAAAISLTAIEDFVIAEEFG